MSYVSITQTAKYLPSRVVSNEELSTMMETSDEWIYSRTGIRNRHVVTKQNTSDLCSEVGKQLLEKSGYHADTIDFIIVATMTPDYNAPATACLVQDQIQATKAMAFDVSAACSGFIYALSVGEKLLSSGKYQRGMVIGGETMSKIIDWEDRSTAVLFGDGAAGVLLEKTNETASFLAEKIQADGSRGMSLTAGYQTNTSPFFEETSEVSSYMQMDGRSIFDFALRNVSANIQELLQENDVETDKLDFVLAHQANVRILDAIAKKTKLPREKFLSNIEHYGNTSGASVALLLHDCITEGTLQIGSGQKVVLTGFGGGLTWGSILLSL